MIILHISPIVTDSVNGLRFSVPGLIRAQQSQGATVACMNIRHTNQSYDFEMYDKQEIRQLPTPFDHPDLVIFHGVYWKEYLHAYRHLNCPYIIVPRSSLTRQAQNQRKWKKRLGNLLGFGRFLRHSARIHYLNQDEADQSSWLGHPYFIVGNGMDVPNSIEKKTSSDVVRFATIGRYDLNHKGLDLLLEAIKMIESTLRSHRVQFHFYGSDHKNNKAAFRDLIEKYAMKDLVTLHQAVYDQDKHDVLCSTDIFISTSRFEGHPMAVLEAMAYGIPCILTPGTHMVQPCQKADAGWTCGQDPKSIASVILMALDQKDRWTKKGENARQLILDEYSWDQIGKQSLKHYEEVMNEYNQGQNQGRESDHE